MYLSKGPAIDQLLGQLQTSSGVNQICLNRATAISEAPESLCQPHPTETIPPQRAEKIKFF